MQVLTRAQQESIAILVEELGECGQACGKILRHGPMGVWVKGPDDRVSYDNIEGLARELGDLMAAVAILVQEEVITDDQLDRYMKEKLERIQPFLHHIDARQLSLEF